MNTPNLKKSKTIFKGIGQKTSARKSKPPKIIKKKKSSFNQQFPKNFRFIPEMSLRNFPHSINLFYFTRFLLFTLVLSISLLFADILITLSTKQHSNTLYEELQSEKQYWTDVSLRYPAYRDAYIQLAVVMYQLGEKKESMEYAEKSLTLDPNNSSTQILIEQIKK